MNLATDYWPWWLGATALAASGIGHYLAMRRPMGVSGSWQRIVTPEDREAEAEVEALLGDPRALEAALEAATLAQFGSPAPADAGADSHAAADVAPSAPAAPTLVPAAPARVRWSAHLTFLVALAIGGLLSALLGGGPHLTTSLGAGFNRLFGSGAAMGLVLVGGGFLVGFGTTMAGGCTSGHGLSGCSRLQPGSLVATAAFVGAAVAASFALEAVLR